jgi:hypothetical protein
MSNNDLDRTDQRKALDEFANAGAQRNQPPSGAALVRPTSGIAERVIGAQPVAVQRDEKAILAKLSALAAAAGSDWFYRFPVNNQDGTKGYVEGPSIKLANSVARIYGNCINEVREIDVGDAWVFYARFTDVETGFSMERAYRQRKGQRSLKTKDADRQLDIAYQIGQSKAIRNCIVNALEIYCEFAFQEAMDSLVNKIGKDLAGWRDRTIQGIRNMGIDVHRVDRVIGRPAKDWLAADVARVIAMMKSVADGMADVNETFPADQQVQTPQQQSPQTGAADPPPREDSTAGAGSSPSSREHDGPAADANRDQSTDADEAPGDRPEEDVETDAQAANLRAAFIAGQSARRAGVQRRAVPPEYRARERSADAKSWLDGWDAGGE